MNKVSKPIEHAKAASNQAEPEIKATVLRNDSNHIDLPKKKEANVSPCNEVTNVLR